MAAKEVPLRVWFKSMVLTAPTSDGAFNSASCVLPFTGAGSKL